MPAAWYQQNVLSVRRRLRVTHTDGTRLRYEATLPGRGWQRLHRPVICAVCTTTHSNTTTTLTATTTTMHTDTTNTTTTTSTMLPGRGRQRLHGPVICAVGTTTHATLLLHWLQQLLQCIQTPIIQLRQPQQLQRHGVISDLLVDDCWAYRSRGGVHLPGGLSPWLARWCGTCCRTTWETSQSAETVSASI